MKLFDLLFRHGRHYVLMTLINIIDIEVRAMSHQSSLHDEIQTVPLASDLVHFLRVRFFLFLAGIF